MGDLLYCLGSADRYPANGLSTVILQSWADAEDGTNLAIQNEAIEQFATKCNGLVHLEVSSMGSLGFMDSVITLALQMLNASDSVAFLDFTGNQLDSDQTDNLVAGAATSTSATAFVNTNFRSATWNEDNSPSLADFIDKATNCSTLDITDQLGDKITLVRYNLST